MRLEEKLAAIPVQDWTVRQVVAFDCARKEVPPRQFELFQRTRQRSKEFYGNIFLLQFHRRILWNVPRKCIDQAIGR